jgi:hypothetical protein
VRGRSACAFRLRRPSTALRTPPAQGVCC